MRYDQYCDPTFGQTRDTSRRKKWKPKRYQSASKRGTRSKNARRKSIRLLTQNSVDFMKSHIYEEGLARRLLPSTPVAVTP